MANSVTSIIVRKDTMVFHVHGTADGVNAGTEGVWLAKGQVDNIYDAPVKTTYKTGAFQDGSTMKARKFLHRDMPLGFHIRDTDSLFELNESAFRQIFDYQVDPWDPDPQPTSLEVTTTLSGTRTIDVLMHEQPEFASDLDPIMQEYGNLILKLRAGQPMWYEDDYVDVFSTSTAGTATGTVTIWNPTDQICRHRWVLTRGTWTLPDYQWVGVRGDRTPDGPFGDRTITLPPLTDVNGGAVVSLDRQDLMLRDAHDTNILPLLGGRFFSFAIPPYTPPTEVPVKVTGAPSGGAMCQLVMPRRWSRPWGLELLTPGS